MPTPASDSTIVVYFSRAGENYYDGGRRTLETGNTAVLARMLIDRIGCEAYEVRARDPYSADYDATVARNVQEQRADARPAIAGQLPDLSGYDRILLGSPIWNVRPPMIMHTFIDAVDWTGKTLHPFVTYAVSGAGETASRYRTARGAQLATDVLAVRGEDVHDAAGQAAAWVRRLSQARTTA